MDKTFPWGFVTLGFILALPMLYSCGVVGVFVYTIIWVGIGINIRRRWNAGEIHASKKEYIRIGAFILSLFVAYYIALTDWAKPSTVDTSPFLQVDNIQFNDIDSAVEKLQNSMDELDTKALRTNEVSENNQYGMVKKYSYIYNTDRESNYFSTYVETDIVFYGNSEQAKSDFDVYKGGYGFKGAKYVPISDNIDVLLGKSRLIRNVDEYNTYSKDREIYTCVRINSIIIRLSETAYDGDKAGQATNVAIEKLCGVLADWAATNAQ